MQTPLPDNEAKRLEALNAYGVLDTPPEQFYDDIAQLAAYICETPIALLSLIDGSHQWLKAKVGVTINAIPRRYSFCAHAILQPDTPLVVRDTLEDPRFAQNPLVTGDTSFRFYAGVPLVSNTGAAIGTLSVIDTQPRDLDEPTLSALRRLSHLAMAQLELGKTVVEFHKCQAQLTQANQELIEQNNTDDLTQLKKRHIFEQTLDNEWERTFRHSNPLSLLKIDVDQFKSYRDEFGRSAADSALQKVAELISHGARHQLDLIARYADDEFAMVLPETDSEGALQIAERIRYRVEKENWPNRPITISIGVSSYNGQADADSLLTQADQALYRAKEAGRNCVMLAT